MKNYILFLVFSFSGSAAFAQLKVGNNPTVINPSAMLDVESTNRGFLPPRVQLNSRLDQQTIQNPAPGLLVFNVGDSPLPLNLYDSTTVRANNMYIWNGNSWERVIDRNPDVFSPRIVSQAVLNNNGGVNFSNNNVLVFSSNQFTPTHSPRDIPSGNNFGYRSDGSFVAPGKGFYQMYVMVSFKSYGGRNLTLTHGSSGVGVRNEGLRGNSNDVTGNVFHTSGIIFLAQGQVFPSIVGSLGGTSTNTFTSEQEFEKIQLIAMRITD